MECADVIELDSSDEETGPPPKKRKPVPNAMVHIPTILPGITIKPAKGNKSNTFKGIPIKQSVNKPIKQNAIPKHNIIVNPFVNKLKSNAVSIHKTGSTVVYRKEANKPLQSKDHYGINPVSISKNSIMSQVKRLPKQIVTKKSMPIQGPTVLNTLPSSITVKKASAIKPIHIASISSMSGLRKNMNTFSKKPIPNQKELLTVNLDDEEITESTSSPQWYLRPEEETNKLDLASEETKDENTGESNLEEQNNKEPESKNYVEITIEDSPMKPVQNKHMNEIGRELPIIIEDSPCKKKSESAEKCSENMEKTVPQSKKRLNYPNDQQDTRQVVEIEIDPIETTTTLKENVESKDSDNEMTTKNKSEVTKQVNDIDNKSEAKLEAEFHPTYQTFIDTCFELENSDDMKKIVEKKIKTYYKQCPKEYVESEEFIDMVSSKIISMKAGPDKMYLYIKDIVDELNLQRKMAKSYETKKEITPKVSENKCEADSEDEGECDTKRSRQIRKLEKTIKKLHRAIQKLEEQEVDFDDEDDSVFLLTERYKERLVRVHAKFCQMTNTKMPSEPRILIEARPGRPLGPAKKLEKFINKKVPIGTPLPFPDFHDVLRCVREANDEDRLGWNEMDIKEEARDLFARCGKKLQRRRQENEWRIAASRIPAEMDPAEENENLKQKLNENKLLAAKREAELLNKYVDRQNQLKLEAEEIGDKEAEESPVESDEEEIVEASSSLEDKHKRKERLKRLIQEKGKKVMDAQVTISVDEKDHEDGEEKEAVDTENKNNGNNDKSSEENGKESEVKESTLDNTVNVDTDDLNNNDDKETASNSNDVDSDIDELHLLQKLHFESDKNSSSCYSTDSESPIAISDTLESDSNGENERMPCSDVISIENSSYSESEIVTEADTETLPTIQEAVDESVETLVSSNLEIFSTEVNNDTAKTNNEDLMEDILLASSEDDVTSVKDVILEENETSINLKDDALSISETLIEGEDTEKDKNIGKKDEVTKNVCDSLDNDMEVNEEVLNKNESQSENLDEPKDKELNEPTLTLSNDTSTCKVIDSIGKNNNTKDLVIGEENESREECTSTNSIEGQKT